ncbi:MAG: hypothetical protein A3E85_05790 [Gammaproteobacteria bacterium RIFCSPHIGHO2_12_FULL_45_12]|nr:MAG: hypothetical protein A3E85_05790 [Gammaproteobacteria bacterium RIFCSPHIGHO2_12_FULL_45_12]
MTGKFYFFRGLKNAGFMIKLKSSNLLGNGWVNINRIKLVLLCLMAVFLPFKLYAWNAVAHKVVANIAYQQLTPTSRATVDSLVVHMREEYPDLDSFASLATWPDVLKSQKITVYGHWHYIDIAFSQDGTPLKNIIDTDNAVWIVSQLAVTVGNARANISERARFLAFLAHIVGDLHQPLHTVSYFSATHLNGDRGGNDYFVKVNHQTVNLHQLWDGGVGAFDADTSLAAIQALTSRLIAAYPENYFGAQASDFEPDSWAKEGLALAQQYVYSTSERAEVSAAYRYAGQKEAAQQVALAGYRLGALLNELLDPAMH